MPRRPALIASFCLALAGLPCRADEVVVFAAASLKTALDAVAADFTAATGHQVRLSYGGSNMLARQILEGAPADVFLSAAPEWMDVVEEAGLLAPGTRRDLLGNSLVLIAHGAAAAPVDLSPDLDLAALLGDGKLSMALVDSVPAGQYGKAALQSLGLWSAIEASVAQSDNVRAALQLVAQGEAPYGITYVTDAAASADVTVVATFPEASHPPILYPVALLAAAADPADRAFFDALGSDAAKARFADAGFRVLP